MKIIYKDASVEKLCTTEKAAKKFFNDMRYFVDLQGVINLIDRSPVLSDLIAFPQLHFHPTDFYIKNSFGLDISGRKSMYRLIVVLLDDSENIVVKDDKFFSKCKQIRILRIEVNHTYIWVCWIIFFNFIRICYSSHYFLFNSFFIIN